jgi:hypothetical protein
MVPTPDPEPGGEQPPPGDGAGDRMRRDGATPPLTGADGPGTPGGSGFGRDEVATALRPGPLLWALAEQAAAAPAALTGHELLAMVSAARRLAARAEYLELTAVAEFTRRARAACDAAAAAGDRPGRRAGEFAVTELAFELTASDHAAADRMELAADLATRLPHTFAQLSEGVIDGGKAWAIWYYTRFLSDTDAAYADEELAKAAPELRYDSLARKAAKLEMKLDPDGVRRRKEHARREGRRVEARREASGNMSFGGRELDVTEALAAKACNDADAIALRRAGLAGSLRELRVLAMLDRIAGRNPLDRLTGSHDNDNDTAPHGDTASPDDAPLDAGSQHDGGCDDEDNDADQDQGRPAASRAAASAAPGSPAPLPALINLLVPAGTLLGWSTTPGDAGSWGLLDPDDTRTIVQAASQHPSTRWCVTVTGPDGTAIAHGCARGPHPWTPAPPAGAGGGRDGPGEHQQAQLAALLRALNITFAPIAQGTCDHRHREDRYTPSRLLKHLVRARTATCPAPGCGAHAAHCDLDHTLAWPDGPSCECNFGPPCRRHHRVKQAPGWHLEQPEPGVMRWTTPSGRVHTTTPTVYNL